MSISEEVINVGRSLHVEAGNVVDEVPTVVVLFEFVILVG
jgi:hypothetical protein